MWWQIYWPDDISYYSGLRTQCILWCSFCILGNHVGKPVSQACINPSTATNFSWKFSYTWKNVRKSPKPYYVCICWKDLSANIPTNTNIIGFGWFAANTAFMKMSKTICKNHPVTNPNNPSHVCICWKALCESFPANTCDRVWMICGAFFYFYSFLKNRLHRERVIIFNIGCGESNWPTWLIATGYDFTLSLPRHI